MDKTIGLIKQGRSNFDDYFSDVDTVHDIEKDLFYNWHTSSLIAIIRSEIERKKGMLKDTVTGREDGFCRCGVSYYECDCVGYNTALNEDIAYLENALSELTPSAN